MTSMLRRPRLRMALLVVLAAGGLAAGLAGCGGGGDHLSRFDTQIEDSYARLSDAIERENLDDLLALVSLHYLQDGTNYEGFKATFTGFFDQYDSIRADYRINRIEYDDNSNPQYARVNFDQLITGLNVSTNLRDTVDNETREMIWRDENGRWVMYGNQSTQPSAASIRSSARARDLIGWHVVKK